MSMSLRRAQPPPGLRPLLSSFPAPPSHIPASPAVSSPTLRTPLSLFPANEPGNPPPTGPPTAPLPPLPEGPSRITDEEQIAFITMRRASYTSSSSRMSSRSHPQSRRSSYSNSGDESLAAGPVPMLVSAGLGKSSGIKGSTGINMDSVGEHIDEHDEERDGERAPTPSMHTSPNSTLGSHLPAPTRACSRIYQGCEHSTEDGHHLDKPHFYSTPDDEQDRSMSPDIAVLIQRAHTHTPRSSTPATRPARRSRSSHSSGRQSTPRVKRLRSTPSLGQSSVFTETLQHAPPLPTALVSTEGEDDVDLDTDTWESTSADAEPDKWDEIWEDEKDESEEGFIDLRTPLPHLMLRAGLLSPHSKLLPRPPSPKPIPHPIPSSKKTLLRDDRDTEKRRERHKDGNLLRGGIGLTTGLGWSDSEDEDAPSALTHRLSRLAPTLSRKSSMASSLASSTSSVHSPSQNIVHPASTRSTTVSRAGSYASSVAMSRASSTSSASTSLSRSTSSRTLGGRERERDRPSALPYLSTQPEEVSRYINILAYPYDFPPPTPTDPGHESLLLPLQISGPAIWRPPRSPLFDSEDPFARQIQYSAPEDRSPTPTNVSSGSGSTASLSIPATPHSQLHSRPPSKALPPLPVRTSSLPKTASMSSLSSLRSLPSPSSARQGTMPTSASVSGLRERTESNASTSSAASAVSAASFVRPRPYLPTTKMVATRPRTTSTSSAGSIASVRPLKSAIKPESVRNGMVVPRSRFTSSAGLAATGIAI